MTAQLRMMVLNKAEMAIKVMDAISGGAPIDGEPEVMFALFAAKNPEDAALVKNIVNALVAYFVQKMSETESVQ